MFPGIKSPWSFTLNLSKFLQANFNIFLFKVLPFQLSRLYMRFLGRIYFIFRKKEKALIKKTQKYVFEDTYSPKALNSLYHKTFRGIIDHYHEKLYMAYSNFPKLQKFFINGINIPNEDQLKAEFAKGKGIILVTAHYSAVEGLPGALVSRGYPVTLILRFQTEQLKDSLVERSKVYDIHLVDIDEGNVFMIAVNALKNGRILITECDEFDAWRTSKRYPVSFLNQKMDGDRTLEILRKRSKSALAMALMQRDGNKRYTLNLTTFTTEESNTVSVGKASLNILEKAITKNPAHWYQWSDFGEKLELNSQIQNNEKQPESLEEEKISSVS
jgi:Kdo2-lipid IVA lauroyltransferase/acyltransferase